jgi:hypothetical protein
LITHGFGSLAVVAAMSALQNYLSELIKCVDKSAAGQATPFQTSLTHGEDGASGSDGGLLNGSATIDDNTGKSRIKSDVCRK